MPRPHTVYRPPVGFHAAYVAAPSQKAALEAWGSDANLFARGVAEVVTVLVLTKTPHKADAEPPPARGPVKPPPRPPKPRPRPSRARLDAAEQALDDAERRHRDELAGMRDREQALARERRAIEARQAREAEKLARVREREKEKYDRAIARWRD